MNEEEGLPHEVNPGTGAMDVDCIPAADMSSSDDGSFDAGAYSQL